MLKKRIKVGIIGLGYVGLPLAIKFSLSGVKTFGFDTDEIKVKILNSGKSYIKFFPNNLIKKISKKNFIATSDFSLVKKVDFIVMCLPTPLKKNKSPQMKFIKESFKKILPYLKKNQCLSLESTTYPGTCEEIFVPKLKKKFNLGQNFYLVYSPEREDPGNKKYQLGKIPKIIGGFSKRCLKNGKAYYELAGINMVEVSNIKTAEFTKLLENIYRSVNIGLVNELKLITTKLGVNIFEVINSAKTKPFGFQAFYPGPGYGGHCIPIDPFLLAWKAKQLKMKTQFIELSGKINNSMPLKIVNKCISINKKKKTKVLIISAAYKKNVDDMRESPALAIMDIFSKKKVSFEYHDPYIDVIPRLRNYNFKKKSIILSKKNIEKFDIILIITDHDKVNYNLILKYAKKIIDTRGKYYKLNSDKVISV